MTERSLPRLRLVALMAVLSMLAASCGLSRDSADGTAADALADAPVTTVDDSADGDADGDGDGEPAQGFVEPVLPDGVTAATITFDDGSTSEISSTQLNAFFDTIASDEEFSAAAFGAAGTPPGLRSSILSDMIIGAVLENLLEENDATVSDENRDSGLANLEQTVASFFPNEDDPAAAARDRFESLPYLRFLVGLQANQQALGDALVAANSDGTVEVPCSSHILVATEDEANDVIALLDDGGDFAELAMEFSTGPSGPRGGELGCTDPAGFVPPFRDAIVDAPIGTIIGPVQTDFGFHVITVTDIQEQAVNAPDAQSLVSAELQGAVSRVTVDVDPLLGEWNGAAGSVIPPG